MQDNIDLYERPFTFTAVAGKTSPTEDEIYNFLTSLSAAPAAPTVSKLPLLTAVYTKKSADKSEVEAKLTDPVISELANYLAVELKTSASLTESGTDITTKIKTVLNNKSADLAAAIFTGLPKVITRIKTMYNDAVATLDAAAAAATAGTATTAGPVATAVLLDLAELKLALQSMLKSDVNIEAINDGGRRRKFRRSDGRKAKRSDDRRKHRKRSDGKRPKGKGRRKSPK